MKIYCNCHNMFYRDCPNLRSATLHVKDTEQCPFLFNGRKCGLPKGHLGGHIPYKYLRESDDHGPLCPCNTCFAERARKFNGSVGE